MGHKEPFQVSFTSRLIVKFSYCAIFLFGYLWEFAEFILSKLSLIDDYRQPKPGYAPLCNDFGAFYTRHLYGRIKDCWSRPISSLPGAYIDILEREGTPFLDDLKPTGKIKRCLNLGSYNYLGFSENSICIEKDVEAIENYASSTCSARLNYGTLDLHREVEKTVAAFLGKEDAIVLGMGFSTNSTTMNAFAGEGSLIVSDALNHSSLIVGYRNSGASNAVFKHNDPQDLEKVLKKSISQGNPKTKKPWSKIIIVVEGLYSMEGTICRLPEFIELKKKYKAYLYVDEAHSIGALGKTGRGVAEYFGVNPADIDVLMGTFTKSFASAGGYLASSKSVVDAIRAESFGSLYDTPLTPACIAQILTSWSLMRGPEGTDEVGISRMERLRRNSLYVRPKLKEHGFLVAGDDDSPIIPILMYSPIIVTAFSRLCLEHNLAVVVVGFPATDLYTCRVRLCMSAVHTLEELEKALKAIVYLAEQCAVQRLK